MNISLRFLLASAVAAAIAPLSATAQQASLDLTGYNLSFSDEFNGPLDVSNWGPGTRWIAHKPDNLDFGNAKFGYTPPSINPYVINNGILEIRAWDQNSTTSTDWRAGLLSSIGRSSAPGTTGSKGGYGFAQRYGYFEARIKCPAGSYVWPAFWLLTAGNFESPAKGVGEIDHLENWGSTTAWSILHYWVGGTDLLSSISSTTTVSTIASEFHTYGIMVKPDVMKFYIDGIERWQQPTHFIFNDPLFVLANYAFDSSPANGTVPQSMFIDYIRVYEAPPSDTGLLPRSTYAINGVDSQDPTNTAAMAVDGNYATAWTSASGIAKPHEIKIDLGSAKTVSGIRYLPRQTTGNLNDLISSYEIRVSANGSTWTLVDSGTWSNTPLEKTATFEPQNNIRYVSLKDVGTGTSSGAAEINVISSTGGAAFVNLAASGTISAYSNQDVGFEAAKAIDGTDNSDSNHWSASGYPQWIEVDLGANKQIYSTELDAVADRVYLFRVETKAEGGSYQTVVDGTVSPGAPSGTAYDFAPVTARYVKLTVTGADNYTGDTTNIREFKIFGTNEVPAATLAAYYTLNNLTTGIQNLGADGATSNLSPASSTATPTGVTGMIGGGLSFDGNDVLGAFTASPPVFLSGNVGTDLGTGRGNYAGKYPYSIAFWYNVASTTASGAAVGLSQVASSDRYITAGVTSGQPSIGRRNTTQYTTSASGVTVGAWHNAVAVYSGDASILLYVDGKLAAGNSTTSVPMMASNSLSLGGVYRSSTQLISPFTGQLDDVGLFYNGGGSGLVLTPADAALINGLGRTGAIGLDQLASARNLANASVGATASIGGATWQRASGLTGVIGDWGGSVANGNAFIVTGASGNGIRVVAGAPQVVVHQAETLNYTASDTVTQFNESAAGGGSADRLDANAIGDVLTYAVPISQAGTWNVKVRYKTYSARGRFQLSVDGTNVGGVVDQYSSSQTWVEVDLGNVAIAAAGNRSFAFTVVSKNDASSGYSITVDYIKLTKN